MIISWCLLPARSPRSPRLPCGIPDLRLVIDHLALLGSMRDARRGPALKPVLTLIPYGVSAHLLHGFGRVKALGRMA
jgi:hypothetical protein